MRTRCCWMNNLSIFFFLSSRRIHMSGNSATFLPSLVVEIFAKVLKEQDCLRQNLLVAVAVTAVSAKSSCGEERFFAAE